MNAYPVSSRYRVDGLIGNRVRNTRTDSDPVSAATWQLCKPDISIRFLSLFTR